MMMKDIFSYISGHGRVVKIDSDETTPEEWKKVEDLLSSLEK
jgi:hypothetical protein